MIEPLLITLFAICFALVAWRQIDLAITACIVLLPAYLIRFSVGPLPSTILEVMILIIFVVWLVRTFGATRTFKQNCCNIYWPWRWQTLIFVIAGVIAVVIAPDLKAAAGLWRAYVLEPLLFFIVFVNVIKTKHQVRQVVFALGASASLVGLYTLLQSLGWVSIPAHYALESPPRATSIFPFPTAVGKYLGPIIAFFIGMLVVQKEHLITTAHKLSERKFFFTGVVMFGLIGLLLSLSRGAIIGVVAALVITSFFSAWKKWLWAGFLLAAILTLAIPQTRNELQSVVSGQDVSADVHRVMWKGAARIVQDNPILGTGLASFPLVYDNYKEPSHTEYFPNPDNLVLTLWIEMGLLGLLLFTWIVVSYFIVTKKIFITNRVYAAGLTAAMVAFLVHGLVDTPYFKNDLAVSFWIFAGLAISIKKVK